MYDLKRAGLYDFKEIQTPKLVLRIINLWMIVQLTSSFPFLNHFNLTKLVVRELYSIAVSLRDV